MQTEDPRPAAQRRGNINAPAFEQIAQASTLNDDWEVDQKEE